MSAIELILQQKKIDKALRLTTNLVDLPSDRAVIRISAITIFGMFGLNSSSTWVYMAQELIKFLKLGGSTHKQEQDMMTKPISRFITGTVPGDSFTVRLFALYIIWKSKTAPELWKKDTFQACYGLTNVFDRIDRLLEVILLDSLESSKESDACGNDLLISLAEDHSNDAEFRNKYRIVGYLAQFVEKRLIELGAETQTAVRDNINMFSEIGIKSGKGDWLLNSNEREIYLHTFTEDGKIHLIARVQVKPDWGQYSSWKYAIQLARDLLEETRILKQKKISAIP